MHLQQAASGGDGAQLLSVPAQQCRLPRGGRQHVHHLIHVRCQLIRWRLYIACSHLRHTSRRWSAFHQQASKMSRWYAAVPTISRCLGAMQLYKSFQDVTAPLL